MNIRVYIAKYSAVYSVYFDKGKQNTVKSYTARDLVEFHSGNTRIWAHFYC